MQVNHDLDVTPSAGRLILFFGLFLSKVCSCDGWIISKPHRALTVTTSHTHSLSDLVYNHLRYTHQWKCLSVWHIPTLCHWRSQWKVTVSYILRQIDSWAWTWTIAASGFFPQWNQPDCLISYLMLHPVWRLKVDSLCETLLYETSRHFFPYSNQSFSFHEFRDDKILVGKRCDYSVQSHRQCGSFIAPINVRLIQFE